MLSSSCCVMRIQITIDCTDSARLLRFWAEALHYDVAQPPDGSATWADYWRAKGMPEEELAEFDEARANGLL